MQVAQTVQPRRHYPPEKSQAIEQLSEIAKEYRVIVACKLFKVRAGQLMLLRKNFRGQMRILVAKNNLIRLAFNKSRVRGIREFAEKLEGQNALIFTNLNPFKLYLIFERSKVNLPARAGDVVTEQVVIPAGNTGIPPGPVLSEFKETGVPTRIETGSIFVSRDAVVAKPGDVVAPKLAGLLARLNLKPIKAGLSMSMALSDGLLYKESDVRIDLGEYTNRIKKAVADFLRLAVEASYVTKESAPVLIAKALRQASEVAVEAGYLTKDTANTVVVAAQTRASALLAALKGKGYPTQ